VSYARVRLGEGRAFFNLGITREVIALQWFADASTRAPWRAWRTACDRITLKDDVGVRAAQARRLL
jgi:hypothetical protein